MSAASPAPQEHTPAPSRWFLVASALILLALSFVLVRPYLGAIILAGLLGFLLQPVQKRLVRIVRSPSVAAMGGVVLVLVTLVGPALAIAGQLRDEAAAVVEIVRDQDGIATWLAAIAERIGVERVEIGSFVERGLSGLLGAVQAVLVPTITAAARFLAALFLFFFLLFFALRDGDALFRFIGRIMPLRPHAKTHLFSLVAERTRALALGTFLVSLAQGVVAGLGWWFFGFPSPVFWAFVMTILAVLPIAGPALVMVPAGIVAAIQGDLFAGIGIIVYGLVVVSLLDNFLRPLLVSRGSKVHPAVILVGTIGGLTVFGLSGFILGPLLLSMVGPVLEVWAEESRAGVKDEAHPF